MTLQDLLDLVAQYGYAAQFFALWLGIAGMPIPDEVVVMAGGLVASLGFLKAVPAFLMTYLGVISGLSIGYVLGRKVGGRVLAKLTRKQGYLQRSQALLDRYGHLALCVSYFLPVVRHLVPYLVGINRMSFARYALYSYSTALVWTLAFFLLGYSFGDQVERIGAVVHACGLWLLAGVTVSALIVKGVKRWRKRQFL